MSKKYRHHKYIYTNAFRCPTHRWSILGPMGGCDFHFTEVDGYPTTAGIELHHVRACGYRTDEAPDHINCPVTGEPCWHDGSSFYATENLLPMFLDCLRHNDQKHAFELLEQEAYRHFSEYERKNEAR